LRLLLLLGLVFALGGGKAASAATFSWASDLDPASMDPYAQSDAITLAFDANIYEPLVRRDRKLTLEPALATGWERSTPTTWRFHLRPGVKFAGGETFTAEDVLFSFARANGAGSAILADFSGVKSVHKLDDLSVEFETLYPDPIFPQEITGWGIMSRTWCEQHGVTTPRSGADSYAADHADGTGPFILKARDPGHQTTLVNNPAWWDQPGHNLTEARLVVIRDDAARVAALLSGTVDLITAVPQSDIDRISHTPGLAIIQGQSLCTVFLGMDQAREQLQKSDARGRNPFKDRRVRLAFYQAIDVEAIHTLVMQGESRPTGLLYGPGVNGYTVPSDLRFAYDVPAARKLMAEAGYAAGFGVVLDCPNGRYLDDTAICQAVASMLARINVRVEVNALSVNPSFFLFGWQPPTYDAQTVFYTLAGTRNGARGALNFGGFSNRQLDADIDDMTAEADPAKRQAEILDAAKILHDDVAAIPLHQQNLVWASRRSVELVQTADDDFALRYVTVH
jgi:peptide/nickel transport system substrate-binding protein